MPSAEAPSRSGETAYTAPPMIVETLRTPGPEWDEFVEAQPGATLGHAAAWAEILQEAYGLAPHYLVARSEPAGPIQGVLPLVRFKRPWSAGRLISLPFLDSAGLLCATPAAEGALLETALEAVAKTQSTGLELRNASPIEAYEAVPGVDRVNLLMTLEADEETQWKALRAKVRNQTRKATREGLELLEADSETLLEGFYEPFAVNMRDLGSPAHSKKFYRVAARVLGERLRFIVAADGTRPVGGLVAIDFAHRVTVPWASTLRSERKRCPNNLIYWEALRWAIERQARQFDFGRSPEGSGTHRFKVGWGAAPEELPWLQLKPSGEAEALRVGDRSAAVERLSQLWTRLPVPLATALGSRLRPFFSN